MGGEGRAECTQIKIKNGGHRAQNPIHEALAKNVKNMWSTE